jgi:hypothetical protein
MRFDQIFIVRKFILWLNDKVPNPIDRELLAFFAFIILMALAVSIIIPHADAAVFVYGSEYNYSEVVLPNNSYVMQMDNITQGNWYDLSGVYGFSGEFAHWKSDDASGFDSPDNIVNPSNPRHVFIDPAIYPSGRWFQWDGQSCDSKGICRNGFGHGNAYAFYVVKKPYNESRENKTITYTSNITVKSANGTVQIPVTYQIAIQSTTEPVSESANVTTILIPTTVPTPTPTPVVTEIEIVTPKSPLPEIVPLFALIIIGVVACRRK